MMVSFVLSFSPRGVLDGILNFIESVSEGFPSYSSLIQYLSIRLPRYLLYGNASFSLETNTVIFETVHKFISDSKRF